MAETPPDAEAMTTSTEGKVPTGAEVLASVQTINALLLAQWFRERARLHPNFEAAAFLLDAYTASEARVRELEADIERKDAALEAAKDWLYNPFEPNNQSRAYHAVVAALAKKEPADG